jgi:hypothetical protein
MLFEFNKYSSKNTWWIWNIFCEIHTYIFVEIHSFIMGDFARSVTPTHVKLLIFICRWNLSIQDHIKIN